MPLTYLITGANRGIGLELARQLKSAGHTVIATARNPDDAADLESTADKVLQLDVTDQSSVDALRADLADTPIDVLVNNAAVGLSKDPFEDLSPDALLDEFNVNSVGPVRVTQALLPLLRKGSAKKIVSITSTLGSIELTGNSTGGGYYAYRASKAALNMLMRTLAVELEDESFTCFVIHPGWVKTRMGGDEAPMSTEQSVKGMIPVIENATTEHSGHFLDYRNKTLPW